MSTCTHIWTWLSAARSEAILARHPRIEETDLLLGLLAQGGPVARTLGAAGVGLARARSAATDLDDADLAGANIPVPRGLRPRRLLVSLAVVQADVDLDLAPGAEDVFFERRGRVRSDRQALLALTAGPRTASSRLLDHLGVDVPELRRRLKTGARERVAGARTVPVPRDLRREGMERARCLDHFVCAPPEVLRGILSDPDRLGQWVALGAGAVVESGAGRVVTEWRRGRRTVRLRHSLACEGESIVCRPALHGAADRPEGRRRRRARAPHPLHPGLRPSGTRPRPRLREPPVGVRDEAAAHGGRRAGGRRSGGSAPLTRGPASPAPAAAPHRPSSPAKSPSSRRFLTVMR